ncbi:MAG: (Fe-S)-binding protein [Kiritimatiellia bacterium]|nr:(Fe-S)-binding protein [Kiritimatiellia bacterium]
MNVSFFATCLADTVFPKVAIRSVELLERLGCRVLFNPRQTCCGQPLANAGYHRAARACMKNLISAFLEDESDCIVAPSGSCVLQVRDYPEFFKEDAVWLEKAERVASRVYEITDFLVRILNVRDVGARLPGRAAYHPSCHMSRRLNVREAPRILLQHVRELELIPFEGQDRCCGFGGTFAVTLSDLSGAMVEEKVRALSQARVDYVIGADCACLMNIAGRIERERLPMKVLHIIEVLSMRNPPGPEPGP